MCGIVGIAGVMPVNQSIYDALTVLQHRGQDAAGIITIDANNCFRLRKANGMVSDILKRAICSVCRAIWASVMCVTQRLAAPAPPKLNLLRQLTVWHHSCPQWQPDQRA